MTKPIPDRRVPPIKATIHYNVKLEDVPASKALHVITLTTFARSRNLEAWLFDIGLAYDEAAKKYYGEFANLNFEK